MNATRKPQASTLPAGFGPGRRPGRFFGGHRGFGRPVEKPKDFKGTTRRLIIYLKPMWSRLVVVLVAAIVGMVLNIVTPKVMGRAITSLGRTVMMRMMGFPAKVDFPYIGRITLWLIGLYLTSALFNYISQYTMAGVAQKTVAVERAGATLFLVPAAEVATARREARPGLKVEGVTSLAQALDDLRAIGGTIPRT